MAAAKEKAYGATQCCQSANSHRPSEKSNGDDITTTLFDYQKYIYILNMLLLAT